LIFIIDFYFTSIIFIPLLLFLFKKKKTKFLPLLSITVALGYILMAYINQSIALNKGKDVAAIEGIQVTRIEAIPLPFSPFRWAVFLEGSNQYHQINVSLLDGHYNSQHFDKRPVNDDIMKRIEELDIVKTYLWFARFPVVTLKKESHDYIVEYFDLRFNSLPPRKPFLLRLVLKEDGSLRKSDLLFHTLKKDIS
jgi:energy-coupling factor transporter transmembrane protein EcfT